MTAHPHPYPKDEASKVSMSSFAARKVIDIPEGEHQAEVARHELAWLIMTARHAQEDRTA